MQIGPFFGAALRHCVRAGIEKVILAAMIGKLAKFAGRHESVHSTSSTQDFVFLADLAKAAGADAELAERITRANTAQEVAEMIDAAGLAEFYQLLCRKAWDFATCLVGPALTVEVYLTGSAGEVLGQHLPLQEGTRD